MGVLNLNSQIIWVLINLLILFLLMRKFLFGPITRLLDARAKKVSDTLDQADSRLAEAEAQKAEYTQQLAAARGAIKKLGGEYKETRTLHLPGGDTRTLILCKKISQTPTAYPRNGGKIAKSPLK